MVEVSFLVAFFGGLLSLLSPCSALLLPAFFAYAFQSRRELAGRTIVFFLGLCVTLVPLGMGISAVSALFYGHRNALITASGALIIAFGILQITGGGFGFGPLSRFAGRVRGAGSVANAGSTFALGAVYGFAGFCSGPILGAVLTVAASSGAALDGAALLAVYAAGMAAPLFLLALLWDGLDLGRRRWLRGREFSVGRLRLHTTNLVSGAMFVALGAVFIAYEGTASLTGLYGGGAEDLALAAQRRAGGLAGSVAVALVLAVLAGAGTAVLVRRLRRREKEPAGR